MSSHQQSNTWRLVGAISMVLLLIILWLIGWGPSQAGCCGDGLVKNAPAPAAAPVASPAVAARLTAAWDGAKVTLSGEVATGAEKQRLVAASVAAFGAGNVVDALTVRAGLAALASITLTGVASSEAEKFARGAAAAKIFSPATIDNQLRVQASATADATAPDCSRAMQLQVSFATGSAVIAPNGKRYLDDVVKCVNAPMLVGGHTDNAGSRSGNKRLSKARANAVKTYLVSKGVRGDMLMTEGFGATKPVANNSTAAGRARNRRIELVAK